MSNAKPAVEHQAHSNTTTITSHAASYLVPDENLVISRDTQGHIISRFSDDIWDVRVYDAKNKCVYNFSSWSESKSSLKAVIIREMKIAQLARLYLSGPPRRVSSTRLIMLRNLARLALKSNTTISGMFNDKTHYAPFISSFAALNSSSMKYLLTLIRELFYVRVRHKDFTIAPPDHDLIESLEGIYNKHQKYKQNPPLQTKLIPTRIYGELISGLSSILDQFNQKAQALIELYQKKSKNPEYAAPELFCKRNKNAVSWAKALKTLELESFCDSTQVKNWKQLSTHLGVVQAAAKYWIHLFSGMRDNEANFLPSNTYSSIEVKTASFKILKGYTSKTAAQNHTATFWVTHEIIEKGIIAANSIGKICAITCGWDDRNRSQYPLFPGRVARKINSGSANKNTWHFEGAPAAGSICDSTLSALISKIPALCIREHDICELELFDGFRNWRDDPSLAVGAPWPLGTHQCRRSLAVYGARSGLLSLGSSALQFKHLTEAMASYYRKDSLFAINFLQTHDAQNWIAELEHERRAAQFSNYYKNIINSPSRLWGGEGNRIQQARDNGRPLIITTDRALTEQKFMKGEMAYKVTPVGGCTNLDHCDKISFTSIFACIDCEKSIFDEELSLRKINKGINNLKQAQQVYSQNNAQYRQLESEIQSLYMKLEKRGILNKLKVHQ